MKKRNVMLLLSALLCLSAGCSSTKKSDGAGEQIKDYNSLPCAQSIFFNQTSSLAVSSNGYYSLNHSGMGAYLTFINKEDGTETYLCSKPDCSHTDKEFPYFVLESCDAYIGEAVLGSIVCYLDSIYILEYDGDTFEVSLVKISADGSRHETLMTVGQMPSNGSYFRYVFADDNTVFMTYYDPDTAGKDRTVSLDKIDLRTKEKSSVYTYSGLDVSIGYLKFLDGNVYFRQAENADGKSGYHLMKYRTDTGCAEAVTDATVNSYTFSEDGTLYYYTSTEGLFRYETGTGKAELIRACDDATMYALLACDGTRIYLDNMDNRFYYNEASEHRIFVCDLEGELINSIRGGGLGFTELADGDNLYAKTLIAGENGGEYWSYINGSDLAEPNAEWTLVER